MRQAYTQRKYRGKPRTTGGAEVTNLADARGVAKSRLVPGSVVWAHVPFTDDTGEKARPAVVVARRGRDVTLLPGTSSPRRLSFPKRYRELDHGRAGLSKPTAVDVLRPVTVDVIEVVSVVGQLSESDLHLVLSFAPTSSSGGNDAA